MNDPKCRLRGATIGSAGHVDHGKSTLIEALSSINPDRLIEEKKRGLTIDLGFAWLTLPSGRELSIVDVPGHERFVHNMLAGIGGIDAVLLVIAADEGVMPQTREHLDIINLLEINAGVVVLSKIDLVDDEWANLVADDVRSVLADTTISDAPIVRVSVPEQRGLDDLTRTLDTILAVHRPGPETRKAHLPIDRVFTVSGFGTVVTGTLSGGPLQIGDRPAIYPRQRTVRVRNLQTHESPIEIARPGNRVAVNLGGVNPHELHRGDVLAESGAVLETHRIDARLRMLPTAPRALKAGERVALHIGTAELTARLRILDVSPIPPGSEGWVQWRLTEPIATMRGDRYVIRRLSPAMTIGGGTVVRALARHVPRGDAHTLAALEHAASNDPVALMHDALRDGAVTVDALPLRTELDEHLIARTIANLVASKDVRVIGTYVGTRHFFEKKIADLIAILRNHYSHDPTGPALNITEFAHALEIPIALLQQILTAPEVGRIVHVHGSRVSLANHRVELGEDDEQSARRLINELDLGGPTPPSLTRTIKSSNASKNTVAALMDTGRIVMLDRDIAISHRTFVEWLTDVRRVGATGTPFTVREVRDTLGTSRKFALAFLEHLDSQSLTRRVGDARVWLQHNTEID